MKKANPVASFAANADSKSVNCIACKERHPLFLCLKFKPMTHEEAPLPLVHRVLAHSLPWAISLSYGGALTRVCSCR